MNYIDLIVLIFIFLSCIDGFRKGFIKTLFDTVGIIAAFFASKVLYHYTESFLLNNTKLYVRIYDFLEKRALPFSEILHKSTSEVTNALTESLKLPAELQNILSRIFSSNTDVYGDSFAMYVDKISVIVVRSISFIITFLIIYILLIILSDIVNIVFKLPGLNFTNRIFGGAAGALKSVIILYIVFALSSPLIGFLPNNSISSAIKESESSSVLYENNIILNYLSYMGFYEN